MSKHYTTTWAHMPKPRRAHRDWRNIGVAIVSVAVFLSVFQFGKYVVAKANFDAEYSFKIRGIE